MGFLAFIVKRGKLSEIDIDVDKDWQTKGITNVKQVAALMSKGDLVVKDTNVLIRIPTGPEGYALTSTGYGKIPVWGPKGGALKYYFMVFIYLTHAEAKVTPNRDIPRSAPITTWNRQTYLDAPADYIKRLTPAPALTHAEAIVSVDRSESKNAPVTSGYWFQKVVDGAVADDGGVQTDETAAAQNAVIDDMTLLPAAPAVDDAYYFGFNYKFEWLWLNISTAGVSNWALTEEYWNGGAWVACVDPVDGTNQFMTGGLRKFSHTPQADWAKTAVAGLNWYWIRYRVTAFVNIVTQPKGAQAWCEKFS